jgi:hypothetical protein
MGNPAGGYGGAPGQMSMNQPGPMGGWQGQQPMNQWGQPAPAPKKGFPMWGWFAIGGGVVVVVLAVVLIMSMGGGGSNLTEKQFRNLASTTFPQATSTDPLKVVTPDEVDGSSEDTCSAFEGQTGEALASASNSDYVMTLYDSASMADLVYENILSCNEEINEELGGDPLGLTEEKSSAAGVQTGILSMEVLGEPYNSCYSAYKNIMVMSVGVDIASCTDISSWTDFASTTIKSAIDNA